MNSNRNSRHSQLGLLPRPPLNINALHVNLVEDFIIRIISSLILFLFLPLWGPMGKMKNRLFSKCRLAIFAKIFVSVPPMRSAEQDDVRPTTRIGGWARGHKVWGQPKKSPTFSFRVQNFCHHKKWTDEPRNSSGLPIMYWGSYRGSGSLSPKNGSPPYFYFRFGRQRPTDWHFRRISVSIAAVLPVLVRGSVYDTRLVSVLLPVCSNRK